MRSLTRELFLPTVLLTGVVVASLAYVGVEFARHAGAIERDADDVRAATALALELADASHDEEQWIASLAAGPGTLHGARAAEASAHIARLTSEIEAFPLTGHATEAWSQYSDARRALLPIAEAIVAAAQRGDGPALRIELDKWNLVTDRTDRLLKDFTAYHVNRLDRTVAELQARRTQSLVVAALAIAAGLLLAGGFAAMLARTVVRPIVEMARAAERIQETGTAVRVRGAERDDEVGVLARAFNDMTDRLVSTNATLSAAVRTRDEFISIASHELKTPLTPLALRVQQLLRATRDSGDGAAGRERVAEAARNLDRHVTKMARLVESLLDVSRINTGSLALSLESLTLGELVREALDRVADDLSAAGCEVHVDASNDVAVQADRSRLEQVLVNLLANAAKYAPGAAVAVRIATDDRRARVEVQDRGPGIAIQDQDRIFGRFERAVADRNVSGLGLGLYIAREIVHAHGGELSLRSEPGEGATFVVEVPRSPRAGTTSASATPPR